MDGWLPVTSGESGDRVWRRGDAFAKVAGPGRGPALAEERDRLAWLASAGFTAAPRVLDWDGACLVISAVPGVPASVLPAADLLRAWPSIVGMIGRLHALPVEDCPFDRGLSVMCARAGDVVSQGAVNPDFLAEADRDVPAAELLARVAAELPVRLMQEIGDRVVCHGDACLPNIMVDPASLDCTGLIDLGRLGVADRHVDFSLLVANAAESWTTADQADRAFALLPAPDRERLAFYLRLDPLTWG